MVRNQNSCKKQDEKSAEGSLILLRTKMEGCDSCKSLSQIIKTNHGQIFRSPRTIRVFNRTLSSLLRSKLSARDISGLLNALSKTCSFSSDKELMISLSQIALKNLQHMDPKDISLVLNAYAKKRLLQPKLFYHAANACIAIINDFNAQDISTTLNAYAKLNYKHPQLFQAIAHVAIPIIDTFDSQALSNTVYAFAKCGHKHPILFEHAATAMIPIIKTCNAQNLSNTVNAYARLGYKHHQLFNMVAEAAINIIHTFNACDLTIIITVYARMNIFAARLFESLPVSILSKVESFDAPGLAGIVNSYSKLGFKNRYLFDEVARQAINIVGDFAPKDLAIMLNAYAKMDHRHIHLFEKAATVAMKTVTKFDAQSLSVTVKAFAKMDHCHPRLFGKVTKAAIGILNSFQARDVHNIVTAFHRMGIRNVRLLDGLAKVALANISTFDAKRLADLIRLFYSSARQSLEYGSHRVFPGKVISWIVANKSRCFSKWDDASLAELLHALCTNGNFAKRPDFVTAVGTEIWNRKDFLNLDSSGLVKLAAAFARCDNEPPMFSKTPQILKMTFDKFLSLESSEVTIQDVAVFSRAIPLGLRVNLISPELTKILMDLAIAKASDARRDDVTCILANLVMLKISNNQRYHLLATYRPIFNEVGIFLSETERIVISHLYLKHDEVMSMHDFLLV